MQWFCRHSFSKGRMSETRARVVGKIQIWKDELNASELPTITETNKFSHFFTMSHILEAIDKCNPSLIFTLQCFAFDNKDD